MSKFPVPDEFTHCQQSQQTNQQSIKLDDSKLCKEPPEEIQKRLQQNSQISLDTIDNYLNLLPDDYAQNRLSVKEQLEQRNNFSRDTRNNLMSRIKIEGAECIFLFPSDQLNEYIKNAPPSDQPLIDLIKQSKENINSQFLQMKYNIEVKKPIKRLYDDVSQFNSLLKHKQVTKQKDTEFNFKDFVTKKLMNVLYSQQSPYLGRLVLSNIGKSLTEFHKPVYQNNFAVFSVTCDDTENNIMQCKQSYDGDDYSVLNIYANKGNTVLFEHLEPFPLGVSLPGMGYQIQYRSLIGQVAINKFNQQIIQESNDDVQQEDENNQQSDQNTQNSAVSIRSTVTKVDIQPQQVVLNYAHKETRFPPIPPANQIPHCIFQNENFYKMQLMYFSGKHADKVQPFMEGCQGLMNFWSYSQKNRFLLVRNRNGSIKKGPQQIGQDGIQLQKSKWQLRKLPLVFSCGQVFARNEFATQYQTNYNQKTTGSKSMAKEFSQMLNPQSYIQEMMSILNSKHNDNFNKLKQHQLQKYNKQGTLNTVTVKFDLPLKILSTENQIATTNYIEQFLKHTNAYEHLRRVLSFGEDPQIMQLHQENHSTIIQEYTKNVSEKCQGQIVPANANQLHRGIMMLDKFIGWLNIIFSIQTDKRLLKYNLLQSMNHCDKKRINIVDDVCYSVYGADYAPFNYNKEELFRKNINNRLNTLIPEDRYGSSKVRELINSLDNLQIDPYKRQQFLLFNQLPTQETQNAMLFYSKSLPQNPVMKPFLVHMQDTYFLRQIHYDTNHLDSDDVKVNFEYIDEKQEHQMTKRIGIQMDQQKMHILENSELFGNEKSNLEFIYSKRKDNNQTPWLYGLFRKIHVLELLKKPDLVDKLKQNDDLLKTLFSLANFGEEDDNSLKKFYEMEEQVRRVIFNQVSLLRAIPSNENQKFMSQQSFSYQECSFNSEIMSSNSIFQHSYVNINYDLLRKDIITKITENQEPIEKNLMDINQHYSLEKIFNDNEKRAFASMDFGWFFSSNNNSGINNNQQNISKNVIFKYGNNQQDLKVQIPSIVSALFDGGRAKELSVQDLFLKKHLEWIDIFSNKIIQNDYPVLIDAQPALLQPSYYLINQNPGNFNNQYTCSENSQVYGIQKITPYYCNSQAYENIQKVYQLQNQGITIQSLQNKIIPTNFQIRNEQRKYYNTNEEESVDEQYPTRHECNMQIKVKDFNPLTFSNQLDANKLRTHYVRVPMTHAREAREILRETFKKALDFDNVFLFVDKDQLKMCQLTYQKDNLKFLPQLKNDYTINIGRRDSFDFLKFFVCDCYTTILCIMRRSMVPYPVIPQKYYDNEQTLFQLYDSLKQTDPNEADPHFGPYTLYGCCYQFLLRLREWFAQNKEQIFQCSVDLLFVDFLKLEITNLNADEVNNTKSFQYTAAVIYAQVWLQIFEQTLFQDLVSITKTMQQIPNINELSWQNFFNMDLK